jgi:hypothetical protein
MPFDVWPFNVCRNRHPELVSGSILPHERMILVAGWMLKQVQHDDDFGV